ALQPGETHTAGPHLPDPKTGFYNVPEIKRTIAKTPVVLATWRNASKAYWSYAKIQNQSLDSKISPDATFTLSIASPARVHACCLTMSCKDWELIQPLFKVTSARSSPTWRSA